jgi:hypothetical protein
VGTLPLLTPIPTFPRHTAMGVLAGAHRFAVTMAGRGKECRMAALGAKIKNGGNPRRFLFPCR